jgi:hypothetical protein
LVTEDARKYLEMIQAVISRLASHAFLLKGWSVTLTSALPGFAGRVQGAQLVRLTLVPAVLFWALDAYYLTQERRHRALFARARDGHSPPYTFDEPALGGVAWLRAACSVTVAALHGVIALLALLLSVTWR